MNNYKHNTDISCEVVLTLEDNLDDEVIPESKNYKALCQYTLQDFLDNFLGWFGQECIERYINKSIEAIDENKLNKLAESMSKGFWSDDLEAFEDNPQRSLIIWTAKRIYECGIKNGYRKALKHD